LHGLENTEDKGMAVTNFHYITRMSSGFKVYILEGNYHIFISQYEFKLRITCCLHVICTTVIYYLELSGHFNVHS